MRYQYEDRKYVGTPESVPNGIEFVITEQGMKISILNWKCSTWFIPQVSAITIEKEKISEFMGFLRQIFSDEDLTKLLSDLNE